MAGEKAIDFAEVFMGRSFNDVFAKTSNRLQNAKIADKDDNNDFQRITHEQSQKNLRHQKCPKLKTFRRTFTNSP